MSEGSKEERDPIRYLGYAPSAREPDLSNIVPSVDNRNPRYLERRARCWRRKRHKGAG